MSISNPKRLLAAFIAIVFTVVTVQAQAPQLMSFQSVIRNSSGALVTNHSVGLRLSILQGSITGTAVYTETQTATSNANGLVTLQIGGGTVVSGTFSAIDWSAGPYYIKSEIDPAGGTSYAIAGTTQLLSVAYALYAAKSGISGTTSTTEPVGIVIAFAGKSIPIGWLFCDGRALSRILYSTLFSVIDSTYGSGDGSTTFNLPDYRGLFLRGTDAGAGNDPDTSLRKLNNSYTSSGVGSIQQDASQGHQHRQYNTNDNIQNFNVQIVPNNTLNYTTGCFGSGAIINNTGNTSNVVTDGVHGTPRLSSETRPKNINVNYLIKY